MKGSLQLLNALATKPKPNTVGKEFMFVDARVNGKDTKVLVDTGATFNIIAGEEEKKLSLT